MNRRDGQLLVPSEELSQIADDTSSGAAEILGQAGAAFSRLAQAAPETGPEDIEAARQAVLETCIALALAQPEMTPLTRLASAALTASRTAGDSPAILKSAEHAALNFIASAGRAARDASSRSVTLIPDGARVLTHSRSSTVLAAFVEAKSMGKRFSVALTESRPMLEGRAMAATLAGEGIAVTLIADAAASLVLDGVDLVMFGADTITPADLVNKIGTRMIALAAREQGLPLLAVCDSSKFIREDYFRVGVPRSRNADELWPDAPGGVSVLNSYFEPTPLRYFSGIVTEDGLLDAADAARRAEKCAIDVELLRALEKRLVEIK